MPRAHDPWKFFVGDTWLIEDTLCDEEGVPLDITAATQIEWKLNDEDGVINRLSFTLGSGITIIDPLNGICLVNASSVQTAGLTPGIYLDQIRLFIAGTVSVQSFGVITAVKPLTAGHDNYPDAAQIAFSSAAPNVGNPTPPAAQLVISTEAPNRTP
jgi:hypothetical protein